MNILLTVYIQLEMKYQLYIELWLVIELIDEYTADCIFTAGNEISIVHSALAG